MSALLERLKQKKERRGSKPRCHLLTHGKDDEVAARLTELAAPWAFISSSDAWMPRGFEETAEARLPEADRLLADGTRTELRTWWLAVSSDSTRTPNWDIASTCTIDGKRGLLLVEAKAHDSELIAEETGRRSIEAPATTNARRNHARIGWCIEDANIALAHDTGLPWALARDWNYQMSNRFAWSWKLTDLGVPVVLVYLGFLNANEMKDRGNPLPDHAAWERLVKAHSAPLFHERVWGERWVCSGHPFVPLIRSTEQPLDSGAAE